MLLRGWALFNQGKIERGMTEMRPTASYLAMSGASLVEIAEVRGHKTLQMVRRCAHLSKAHTAGALERMVGRFLE
jgi:hypothetical protein